MRMGNTESQIILRTNQTIFQIIALYKSISVEEGRR